MVITQKVASLLTLLRSIVLSLLVLALILWNFGAVNQSAMDLLSMIPRIQQLEASGVKVILKNELTLRKSLESIAEDLLPEKERQASIEAVKELTAAQVDRLFTIERGGLHCEYTRPTAKMRLYVSVDAQLEEARLVQIEPNLTKLEQEAAQLASGASDIGTPRSCYSMELTSLGYNAKSALVGVIRQALLN